MINCKRKHQTEAGYGGTCLKSQHLGKWRQGDPQLLSDRPGTCPWRGPSSALSLDSRQFTITHNYNSRSREPTIFSSPSNCAHVHTATHRETQTHITKNKVKGADEVGSVVVSTGCASRGPQVNSKHPRGSSRLSITPAPED